MLWRVDPASKTPLRDQICGCVRRGIAEGDLDVGEQLPVARELAAALGVDPNTVLAAYRILRADGVLEFRRGRGVRVARGGPDRAEVTEAARRFAEAGRRHGYSRAELIQLIEELT